jgi:hypothetical protein
MNRGGDRHRRRIGAAAAERGDAAGCLADALETGDDGDLVALLEAADQFLALDVGNARRAVGIARQNRDLPALPGARLNAE